MGKIDNANHQLVIIELENLMTMLESILASDNPSAIINGAISYIILLTLEGISYMNKHKPEAIKYNFKGAYWNAHVLVSSTTKRFTQSTYSQHNILQYYRELRNTSSSSTEQRILRSTRSSTILSPSCSLVSFFSIQTSSYFTSMIINSINKQTKEAPIDRTFI